MFNSAISSNTAFQLETFQYGGLKSNIHQGNVCLTQYNSSANENEEKKNVLSMFFAKSIDDTHSLFSEPERTTKKPRPSRQRGKDKTRIGWSLLISSYHIIISLWSPIPISAMPSNLKMQSFSNSIKREKNVQRIQLSGIPYCRRILRISRIPII